MELGQRVAAKIRARGARGIVGLGKSFSVIDDDNSGQLSVEEFAKAMRDYRITDDPVELQAIVDIFDHDQSGQISYDEFVRTIVGEMNPRRRAIAIRAFEKLDASGDGIIDLTDIKVLYNARKHPDVMMGKRSEDDVLYEFLDTFEAHYSIKHPESRDRKITVPEWLEYYNCISCNIDSDEYFELMMNNAYKF